MGVRPCSSSQHQAIEHILEGGRHLLGLVDDILGINGSTDITAEPRELDRVSVSDVVRDSVELTRSIAVRHQVQVGVDEPDGAGPRFVRADRRSLTHVLVNLVSNAIIYNHVDGRVDIRVRTHGDGQRLGREATDIEGTGIGLALSQRLAASMGGRLEVASTYGIGSTFTVVLPVTVMAPEPDDASSPVNDLPVAVEGPTSTLLYIEDNLPNVRLMQALVEQRPGWTMVHAGHGALGLELATSL